MTEKEKKEKTPTKQWVLGFALILFAVIGIIWFLDIDKTKGRILMQHYAVVAIPIVMLIVYAFVLNVKRDSPYATTSRKQVDPLKEIPKIKKYLLDLGYSVKDCVGWRGEPAHTEKSGIPHSMCYLFEIFNPLTQLYDKIVQVTQSTYGETKLTGFDPNHLAIDDRDYHKTGVQKQPKITEPILSSSPKVQMPKVSVITKPYSEKPEDDEDDEDEEDEA